ncbi:MAG: flhB [Sphingomonadales bacterium]|nr:flhB [Sphingomonadales bacterium]
MSGERTEAATPKHKAAARKRGQLPDIRELSTAGVVAAGAGWLALMGHGLWSGAAAQMRAGLSLQGGQGDFEPSAIVWPLVSAVAVPMGVLFAMICLAAIASRLIGGGLGFNWGAIAPKFAKIDPAAGLQRMFSAKGLIEFGKSVAKLLLLGSAFIWAVQGALPTLLGLPGVEPMSAATVAAALLTRTVFALAVALALIAALDAPIQIGLHNAKLRMTKQQVRDEHRESEHAPEVRQQIHAKRAALLDQSARKAVKEATVILVNPTSFAVALRYRTGIDGAPVVVARARAEAAAALREMAVIEGVPILTYPALTRAIYFTSRSGEVIDEKLYRAVATVLAFVMGLNVAIARRAQPEVEMPDGLNYGPDGRST